MENTQNYYEINNDLHELENKDKISIKSKESEIIKKKLKMFKSDANFNTMKYFENDKEKMKENKSLKQLNLN